MKRISLIVGMLGCLGISGAVNAVPIYASAIVDSTDSNFDATNVLGAPDGNVANFYGVGAAPNTLPGFVTVSFDSQISDGQGNDIVVHLVDWPITENELFRVFASLDGVSFLLLGDSGPPTGSVSPATSTVGFDLSAAGLAAAGFVKIENLYAAESPSGIGPDIDAIEALVRVESTAPEPATLALVALGFASVRLSRKKAA